MGGRFWRSQPSQAVHRLPSTPESSRPALAPTVLTAPIRSQNHISLQRERFGKITSEEARTTLLISPFQSILPAVQARTKAGSARWAETPFAVQPSTTTTLPLSKTPHLSLIHISEPTRQAEIS